MNGPTPAESGVPVADCPRCGREVLTHVHLDPAGEPQRRCFHCDAEIEPAAVRWIDEEALDSLGYAFHREAAEGCGRPGCGRGNCANRR